MATVSFGGLGNGIDFGQVVTELVKIQRLPIDRLNEKKTALQSKLTDLGSLGTKLLAVQSAADSLRLASSFDRTSAVVSDEDVLSVSSSSTAVQGSYRVQVTQLATAHQLTNKAAKAVSSTTDDIVTGTSATLTFRVGTAPEQTVTLGESGTLEDLRAAINDLGAGVTASIVNSGTDQTPAYRLVLTRLQALPHSMIEASFDCGASRWSTLRYVLLPHLASAILTGALLALTLSFDETLISSFVAGDRMTLPLRLWAMMRVGFTPEINALVTLVLLVSIALALASARLLRPATESEED